MELLSQIDAEEALVLHEYVWVLKSLNVKWEEILYKMEEYSENRRMLKFYRNST